MSTKLLIWNIALLGFILTLILLTKSYLGLLAILLVSWNGDDTCPKCGYKFEESEE